MFIKRTWFLKRILFHTVMELNYMQQTDQTYLPTRFMSYQVAHISKSETLVQRDKLDATILLVFNTNKITYHCQLYLSLYLCVSMIDLISREVHDDARRLYILFRLFIIAMLSDAVFRCTSSSFNYVIQK